MDISEHDSNGEKTFVLPKQLMAISALWFGMNFFWSVILPLWLPERVTDFAGDAQKGTYLFYITSMGAFVSTLIQLVIGPISDRSPFRWGRRRPYIFWGTILTIPCFLLFTGASTFGMFLIGFVLIQIILNIATGPYQAIMPDLVPRHKHGLASAYMGFALILGQGCAFVLAGFLVRTQVWLLASIMTVILVGTMLWTVLGTLEKPLAGKWQRVTLKDILDIRLKGNADFGWLIVSRFFINLGFYTATFFLYFYMRDSIGLGENALRSTSILLLTATWAGLLGNWPAGLAADRYSKKKVLYFTCTILGVAVLWFLFVESVMWVYAVGVLFGIGWGAFAAVDWALAVNLVPVREAGRYMAIWHLAWTLPQVIAPAVGPLGDKINRIYGHGLGWRVALGFILIYLIIGVAAVSRIHEHPVSTEEETS
jgi:MFS family permease